VNVLCISASIDGGAGRAAYRLHTALNRNGMCSKILVQRRATDDTSVLGPQGLRADIVARVCWGLDGLASSLYSPRPRSGLHSGWVPARVVNRIKLLNPDVVHLHFTTGFVPTDTIRRIRRPIVWTLHDMWPFTGGCHYDHGCRGYVKTCGRCPEIGSERATDLSSIVLAHKRRAWRDADLTLVAPSRWIGECARSSSLFRNRRIEIIPYGIDLSRFRPIAKHVARNLLQLPLEKKLIMFGAMNGEEDPRKGLQHLKETLRLLVDTGWGKEAELVVFGDESAEKESTLRFPTRQLGVLTDDISLVLAYSAADVFVCPSVEDNLPNTAIEAIACGTPVVGFRIGGLPDLIEHEKIGYLAKPFEANDLARGILSVLSDPSAAAYMSNCARATAERVFDANTVARQHQKLYDEVTSMSAGAKRS
jgi:glycosyltransferase involved in cell wall biosynthesis